VKIEVAEVAKPWERKEWGWEEEWGWREEVLL
jgi:hypothetical protein